MPQSISEGDDRNRQTKALQRWEAQKAEWDRVQYRLAQHVGKADAAATLPGSIHAYRMQCEELGMIDASVPAEVKNGVSAWEMNLRASTGGVRYVQVGSSYPYPLYCPIRDAESVKPDNNVLMKVIPPVVPPRDKPVSDGEYFKSRQHEFQRHIKRKFSHYVASTFFAVEGAPPPRSVVPVPEDSSVAPVQFVPAPQATAATRPPNVSGSSSAMLNVRDESRAPSRPQSGGTAVKPPLTIPIGVGLAGPMIVLSTAHLQFSAVPNENVQATLRIENTGSTAVFYSWIVCEGEAALPFSPATKPSQPRRAGDGLFRLSDVPNGVLLPEDTKFFTVSFRSPEPGIFAQLFELLTIPAGRDRITIHLRAVVVGGHGDVVSANTLNNSLSQSAPRDVAAALLNGLLLQEKDNAFEAAELHRQILHRQHEIERVDQERLGAEQRRREAWRSLNAPLQLHFNAPAYEALDRLHYNISQFAAAQNPPVVVSTPWSGSVRDLLSDAGAIRDVDTRSRALDTIHELLVAVSVATDDDADTPLKDLIWGSASRRAWLNCAERIQAAATTARDLTDGRLLIKTSTGAAGILAGKMDKGGGAGIKAPAPKKAGPSVAPPVEPQVDPRSVAPEYNTVFFTLARRCVSDAIDGMIDLRDTAVQTLRCSCYLPLDTALGNRRESALNTVDKAVESAIDAAALLRVGKRK